MIFHDTKYPVKETAFLTGSAIITRAIALLFSIVLARSLSVSEFGLFKYLVTLSAVYAFAIAGIPIAITKFIGEGRTDKISIDEYLTASMVASAILFIALMVVISIFEEHSVLLIILLFAFFVDSIYLGFIRGLLNYAKLMGYKLVENIMQFGMLLMVFVIYQKISLSMSVIFFSFAGVISFLIFEIPKPEFKMFLRISKEKMGRVIKYSIPVTIGAIGWTVMCSANTVFIERFKGAEAVGYYSVALTIGQVFAFFPDSISTIIMPKVAGIRDKTRIARPLWFATIASIFVSVPILILVLLFKEFIFVTVFSKKYLPAVSVMLPLAIGQISLAIYFIYASVWQGLDKPEIPSIAISIAAILNVIGSFFLTKSYGIYGASVSLAITSIIALLLIWGAWIRWSRRLSPSPNLSPETADARKE
jgi:O-antigen/teichoic acid export membrane protein